MQKELINYHKQIKPGTVIRHMQPEDAAELEALQKIVFPTLDEDELILAVHYLRHLELFPEGQKRAFVAAQKAAQVPPPIVEAELADDVT